MAFESDAAELVTGDTNNFEDIFVHDRNLGQTTRVSVKTGGTQTSGGNSSSCSISGDGRYVAFDTSATDLVTGDTNNIGDVFVHDRNLGQTSRVSVITGGAQANSYSTVPSISADGRYVAFCSYATNMVPEDSNGDQDVFVHDRITGETSRVSVATGGIETTNNSKAPSISADGRYIAFSSDASDVVTGDTNGFSDIFVHADAIRHNAVFRPSASDNWIFTHNLATVRYRDHYGSATDTPLVGDFNYDQYLANFPSRHMAFDINSPLKT